eukprot:scaffold132921_cov17-Prasinocladus_malaysianus.AAC.1
MSEDYQLKKTWDSSIRLASAYYKLPDIASKHDDAPNIMYVAAKNIRDDNPERGKQVARA